MWRNNTGDSKLTKKKKKYSVIGIEGFAVQMAKMFQK